ncbi:MAG: tetratricopeptide repeat protein [Sandaracinaceae bacterium]
MLETSQADEPIDEAEPVEASPRRLDPAAAGVARDAVRAARRLAAEEDFVGSLAAFERALEVLPGAPRVRCEMGYVALRAEQYGRAARELDVALALLPRPATAPPELRVPLAMCLYNRGRVHEALEDPARAALAYRASLSLRDNRIVRGRLDMIVAAQDTEGEVSRPPPSASVDDLQSWLGEACGETCDSYEDWDPDGCAEPSDVRAPSATEQVDGAVLFHRSIPGCMLDYDATMLALRGRAGWWQTELVGDESSTTDNFYRAEVGFSCEASIARPSDAILRVDLLSLTSQRSGDTLPAPVGTPAEDDPGCLIEQSTSGRTHDVVLCEMNRAIPRCGVLEVGSVEAGGYVSVYCEAGETPAWARAYESETEDEEEVADPFRVRVEGDTIVVELAEGASSSDLTPGRYTFDDLRPQMRELTMH